MIPLEELEVYKVALEIGDITWEIVAKWNYFQKDTLGKQFTKAADSIAFNISEGYGRYHYAENRNFCWYSRGSVFETRTAVVKTFKRGLITEAEQNLLNSKLALYFKLVNAYIKSIGKSGTEGQ